LKEAPLSAKILVVDDEKNILALFKKILNTDALKENREAIEVQTAKSGEEAWQRLQSEDFDLIVSDLAMEEISGIELLQRVKGLKPEIPFMMLTGVGTLEDAAKSIKMGAYDYFTKPFERDELLLAVTKGLEYRRLNVELKSLREKLSEKNGTGGNPIIGKNSAILKIFETIHAVSHNDSTVLIEGESGTGKELIAKAIHRESLRREGPFVAINCGAIPETLLESELFGFMRGAFTGAVGDKKGLFTDADHGTLFLDEIADVSLATQAKLLRALQERSVRPIGSTQAVAFDARIVAATNKPLETLIKGNLFREDLFYRLAVIRITVPPLRERKEDIPLLVHYFLQKYSHASGKPMKRIADGAMAAIVDYPWPGNIRELENIIERLVVTISDKTIHAETLPKDILQSCKSVGKNRTNVASIAHLDFQLSPEQTDLIHDLLKQEHSLKRIIDTAVGQIEKFAILQILSDTSGNRAEASRRLGISRPALYKKLKDYGID
jgi:two-component system response regulator AtoC